ncbi:amidohydrolase family protein [Muricoccus radiodurans]|uniref:amidohydrolase family protein n=1 Tax=Muricoccus radiodurans TaxID=2231721 RepID=UPI003CE9BF9F
MTITPLVDTHFHVYTTDMPILGTAWHHPPTDATAEGILATMDAHGVGYGVIAAASLYGTYNDETIRVTRRHKRLRGTVILGPEADLYTMERMKADGIVGVRLFFRRVPNPPDLNSAENRRLLRRIRDLGWHVHVLADDAQWPDIIPAIEASGATLVVDHFGKPDPALGAKGPGFRAILAAVERGRTWVKLSGGFRMPDPSAAKDLAAALIRASGGERLVWASDWPFAAFEETMTYARAIENFEEWVPDDALRHRIGAVNPMTLYFGD